MPTVSVDKEHFFGAIGEPKMTIEAFEELCFEFGVELDEVTSEREMASKEQKNNAAADLKGLSDRQILKIDVSANRYDLLCEEGLARALRVFLGKERIQDVTYAEPKEGRLKVQVKAETEQIRPYIVAAVLRNVKMDGFVYKSLIDLQDKLHQGICRRRTKVAIGTHDLDKIKGPAFVYTAQKPSDINFVPLNQTKKINGAELISFYEPDRKLSKFLHIIKDSPVYPVVYDAEGRVLSLPPIINGDHSKISLDTKNIFIECTATEEVKARHVLNILVGMFSQYCEKPFSVEPVEVVYEKTGKSTVYPTLDKKEMNSSVEYINACIGRGINLSPSDMISLLGKMGLSAKASGDGKNLAVSIPSYRTDILHACDIMEDVAVAYGINKIPKTVPKTSTVAAAFPINKLSDFVRRELAFSGWSEVLTLTLCSHDENYAFLRKKDPRNEAVELANPQTIEYQVVRTSLLPGMLKTLNANKKAKIPIKLFEVGDVVYQDASADRRSRNERRLCVIYSGKTSGFEYVHGVLDRVMAMLSVKFDREEGYSIEESSYPTYFPGRQADVLFKGKVVGSFGILHPEVLKNFELDYPATTLELSLEPFL